MTDPHHQRLERLYGCADPARIFRGDLGLVPWPRHHRRPTTPAAAVALREFLTQPVHLFDIDPRLLVATQPKLVRHHYRHYVERDGVDYLWHARTSADEHSELNRFPVVEPDGDGRFIIRSGHHRAAAALIAGTPLRCRVVDREPSGDAVAVTPRLLVGTTAEVETFPLPAHNWKGGELCSEGEAYAAYRIRKHGSTIVVPTAEAAQRVLARLECDPDWAVTLLRRSLPGLDLAAIPIHPIPVGPARSDRYRAGRHRCRPRPDYRPGTTPGRTPHRSRSRRDRRAS